MRGTQDVLDTLRREGFLVSSAYLAWLLRDRWLESPEKVPGGAFVWTDADVARLRSLLWRRGLMRRRLGASVVPASPETLAALRATRSAPVMLQLLDWCALCPRLLSQGAIAGRLSDRRPLCEACAIALDAMRAASPNLGRIIETPPGLTYRNGVIVARQLRPASRSKRE